MAMSLWQAWRQSKEIHWGWTGRPIHAVSYLSDFGTWIQCWYFNRKGHPNAHVFTSRTLDGSSADSPRSQFSINDWQNQRSCSATAWNLGTLTFGTACSMKCNATREIKSWRNLSLYTIYLEKSLATLKETLNGGAIQGQATKRHHGLLNWRSFAGK